ncbi:MAG: universal stress protein [Acidobacteria bacterium]|nr:universal stress protein [Acidobacteriota bacterium]
MKILVAVDGSPFSLAAVDEASRMPWPTGSEVKFVSTVEMPTPVVVGTMPMPDNYYTEWEKALEDQAVSNTANALARFYEKGGAGVEASAKTLKGDPKVSIVEEAEHWGADLIIVGTHGYNAFERFWLGSVSRSVASHAHCSVEIVRQAKNESPSPVKRMKILLAVDGSECGNKALEEVATRPWPAGSEVCVLSVIHLPMTPTPETWALPNSYYAQVEKIGREQADEIVKKAIDRLSESNASREIPLTLLGQAIIGHAEETIIGTAKEWGADLIVLGSHGYRGFRRFLLGSVSQAVASHAPCSVEIVRAHEG